MSVLIGSLFDGCDEHLFVAVEDEHGQQACRFRVAGVGADFVHGARLFYEVFADVVDLFRLAFDFDAKRALQDRCINEGRSRVLRNVEP